MQNQSPKRDAVVTHVWFDSDPPVPVMTKPLPRTIAPDHEWETFIVAKDAPAYSVEAIATLTRVRLSGDHVLTAEPRTDVLAIGYVPDG